MKIKTKKTMTLPQLIEWAWSNNVKGEFFSIDKNEESGIYFATNNDFMMKNADYIRYNNTFTVEVEEEITEETVIPKMLEVYQDASSNLGADIHINRTINSVVEDAEVATLHIVNDDGTHTLIWCNGKMVE